MRRRLNKKKIYPRRDLEVSKTEAENLTNMKQRFSDEKIKLLQEKLKQWKIDHSWKCICNVINDEFNLNCKCCNKSKFSVLKGDI